MFNLALYENTKRDDRYDSYYDLKTLEWIEPKCSDRECVFCSNRPDKYVPEITEKL